MRQYSRNAASQGASGDCPACTYTNVNGQTVCAQLRAYPPQTITIVGTTAAGVLFTTQIEARPQPTYTLDAAGTRTPATPPPAFSETEYEYVADVRSLAAYGPLDLSYSVEQCDHDTSEERSCAARTQVDAYILGVRYNDVEVMQNCAPPPAPPVVTARRTGSNSATVVVTYAFPATAAHRQIVIEEVTVPPKTGPV